MDFLNQLNPEVLFPALTLCASGLANLLVLLLPLPKLIRNAKTGISICISRVPFVRRYTFINWVALNVGKAKNAVTSTDVASSRRNE